MLHTQRFAKNALWTLLGQGAPMLAGLVSVPILISALGAQRFGVVTLYWLTVGYFSLFDLGLGRATTQLVAARIGRGDTSELPTLIWTAITAMAMLGVLGGVALWTISPLLVRSVLKIPDEIVGEATHAFRVLALAIPAVTVSTGLRGILEARDRFGAAACARGAMGLMTFLGPLAAIAVSPSLTSVALALSATRWITTIALAPVCVSAVPSLRVFRIDFGHSRELLAFGGWITVTNLVSPVMVNIDRFVIGGLLSVAAVGYYATPFEVVTKLNIIPGALVTVLFPAFAAFTGARAMGEAYALLGRAMRIVLTIMFPFSLVVVLGADAFLELWVGAEYALHGGAVLKILAIGVLCNSIAYVPAAFVQAAGRPDLSAKLHLIELPLYLMGLWVLARSAGLAGVAVAWTARVLLDLVLLCFVSRSALGADIRWRPLASTWALACSALIACAVPTSLGGRAVAAGYSLAVVTGVVAYTVKVERALKSGFSKEARVVEARMDETGG